MVVKCAALQGVWVKVHTAAATAALLLLTTVSQLLKASITNTISATPLKVTVKEAKIGVIKVPSSIPILLKEICETIVITFFITPLMLKVTT